MTLNTLQTLHVIETMESFIAEKRPPEEIRDKLDLSYKIEGQSIIIFEISPRWNKPEEKIESSIAKTTYVKSKDHWKVFWMRADLKWHSYDTKPVVPSLKRFIKLVEDDKYGCFWG